MCNCGKNCPAFCPCPCHGNHDVVIGGTRAGKAYLMAAAIASCQWRKDHPKGVVLGQVVNDSGRDRKRR